MNYIENKQMKTKQKLYQVKIQICAYKDGNLFYRNSSIVADKYLKNEIGKAIDDELAHRLKNSMFFRSPDERFDLVRYEDEGRTARYLKLSEYECVDMVV